MGRIKVSDKNNCSSCGYHRHLLNLTTEDKKKDRVCELCLLRLQAAINHTVLEAIHRGIKRFPLRVRPDGERNYYLDIASDLELSKCEIRG